MAKLRKVHISDVKDEGGVKIVFFFHPRSAVCRSFEQRFAELVDSHNLTDATIMVDTTGYEDLAKGYGVIGVPAVALFENGQAKEWVFGARATEFFNETLQRWKEALQPK